MQVKIKLLFILLIFFSCVSCEFYDHRSTPPAHNITFLRFVSPSGTNVLDSLHILESDGNIKMEKIDDDELISICGDRSSDGNALELSKYLFYATSQAGAEFEKEETLLKIEWTDFDIFDVEKQVYTIALKSKKVFGDDDTHYLKWYVNVFGRGEYDAYKCEIDGQNVSLANDLLYNKTKYVDRHFVKAIVNMPCKLPTE